MHINIVYSYSFSFNTKNLTCFFVSKWLLNQMILWAFICLIFLLFLGTPAKSIPAEWRNKAIDHEDDSYVNDNSDVLAADDDDDIHVYVNVMANEME